MTNIYDTQVILPFDIKGVKNAERSLNKVIEFLKKENLLTSDIVVLGDNRAGKSKVMFAIKQELECIKLGTDIVFDNDTGLPLILPDIKVHSKYIKAKNDLDNIAEYNESLNCTFLDYPNLLASDLEAIDNIRTNKDAQIVCSCRTQKIGNVYEFDATKKHRVSVDVLDEFKDFDVVIYSKLTQNTNIYFVIKDKMLITI